MSDSPNQPDSHSLDNLVRADLDRRADAIDPRPMLQRIRASTPNLADVPTVQSHPMSITAHRHRRSRWIRWAGGLSAAAASVVLAIVLFAPGTPAQASPEAMVREAQATASLPLDRRYLVELRRESEEIDQSMLMNQQSRVSLLWTRGDRFMFESVNSPRRFAWGRDGLGNFWVSLNRERGLRFESYEVPQWLTLSADVVGMRMDQLLDMLTRDFDISREPNTPGQTPGTVSLKATLKHNRPNATVRAARMEFDTATKVVRKLVLERVRGGKLVATVTYWLIETESRLDEQYELENQLDRDEIFSRTNKPFVRDTIARAFFAASAGGEIPQMPPLNRPGPNGTVPPPGDRPRMFGPATRPAAP